MQGTIGRSQILNPNTNVQSLVPIVPCLEDTDVIAVVDAFDVLVLLPSDELLRRYHALTNGTGAVVYGIENPIREPLV